jgi:putative serine protease PepD
MHSGGGDGGPMSQETHPSSIPSVPSSPSSSAVLSSDSGPRTTDQATEAQRPEPPWSPAPEEAAPAHGGAAAESVQQASNQQGWWMPSSAQQPQQGDRAATWAQPAYPYGGPAGPAYQHAGQHRDTAVLDTKPAKKRRTTLVAASIVTVALIAGFGGGLLAGKATEASSTTTPSSLTALSSSPTVSANLAPAAAGSVQQVAAAILPSVVSILSSSSSSEGEGSGVILSADGLILTNNHVIDGATTLQVQFNDGTTAAATVVGADATDDLAVIKAQSVSGLTPATLGSSADLQVGQEVVAVGSPLGLSATVTSGIVSALNRPVATSDAQQQDPLQQLPGRGQSQTPAATQATVINAIQTDAAINPGNSGGPLVDLNGAVIGINSAIASLSSGASSEAGSIGVGFAIPIDQAKRIADEIIQTGQASHAVFGASVTDATVDGSSLLTAGATISALTAGGGAEAAGLKVGDVVTKVGEQRVESADALVAAIRSAAPNSSVSISYTRGTADATVTVTLGSSTG